MLHRAPYETRANLNTRVNGRLGWLLCHVNGHWLLEPEGKRSFGPEVDIPFPCEVGDGSSSAGSRAAANEYPFATSRGHADQRASASAASDPAEVSLLVLAASSERGRGAQIVCLGFHLNSVEERAKIRPAHQVSRFSRIHNEALDVSALRERGSVSAPGR